MPGELLVLVGLPGSGKTELARALWPKYEYIDSDYRLHHRARGERGAFRSWLLNHLDEHPDTDFVIDDWFRQCPRWYDQATDDSLLVLATGIPHTVRVLFLAYPHEQARAACDWKGVHARDLEELRAKQSNLIRKVEAFING